MNDGGQSPATPDVPVADGSAPPYRSTEDFGRLLYAEIRREQAARLKRRKGEAQSGRNDSLDALDVADNAIDLVSGVVDAVTSSLTD